MRLVLAVVFLALVTRLGEGFQSAPQQPRLLLTDQRIKRLKRDRERQTQRWQNFESRVKTVSDSPERGFELALYYRVTDNAAIPAQAILWMQAHPCERRQVALLRSALGNSDSIVTPPTRCPPTQEGPLASLRDELFESLTTQSSNGESGLDVARFLNLVKNTPLNDAGEIYAAVEILIALGRSEATAIREQDIQFFNSLPVQFLLSLKPGQVEHPDWKVHLASLALIALDPNSDSAQFLQGWAIEDRQMIQEGPGVAYELLWADPYLPGVGYQNLDPWWYDEENARLLARSTWSADACAISITPGSVQSTQCPAAWKTQRVEFGHLSLIPMNQPCVPIPLRPNNAFVILWGIPPNGHLKMMEAGKSLPQQADRAGMWRVPSNISGRICTAK